eukprot:Pompholyxophrys_punicea_v1_NODE_574_length_1668_cov_34.216483.p1 type:complete len:100 gc:universal NODE_574_length_1668_cov_34.216483:1240-941(-)
MRCGALNGRVVRHFTEVLGEITRLDVGPHQIWNVDETGCSFDQTRLKTYCKRGRKNVYAIHRKSGTHLNGLCHLKRWKVFARVLYQQSEPGFLRSFPWR